MTVEWSAPRGGMEAINAAMNSLMVATRAEPGCLSCTLSSALGDRAGFRYMEEWRTEDDLIREIRSARFSKLAHLLESALEPPRIEFSLPGGTRGMEYAEQVRGGQSQVP